MNEHQKQSILRLADVIESERWDFDMTTAISNPACGTAGCIGGHAAALWPDVRDPHLDQPDGPFSFDTRALADKIGLSLEDLVWLCFTPPTDDRRDMIGLSLVTREAAVEALRHLAETGEIRFRLDLCRRAS